MALRNYSVNDNAVVASSAGLITAGYAVCTTPTNTGYVVASTANRAALTNGWISGIAIGAGVSGAAIPIVNSGHVDASYVGVIGGSGDYVNVQSDGSLVRASSATADTVGHYEDDGGVWVNLGLQAGGAVTGNATAIQGVSVSSAVATKSYEMRGDGSAIRMAPGKAIQAYDYRVSGSLTAASWAAMLSDVPACGEIELYAGDHTVTTPIQLRDDTPGGGKHSVRIVGPGGNELRRAGGARLLHGITEPSTTAATYVSHGTSGTQRSLRLGGWTGLDATLHTGRVVWIWNSANIGPGIVAKVHNATTMSVFFPAFNPVSDATKSGSIRGRIDMPIVDLMARSAVLDTITFVAPTGVRCGQMVNVQNPPGAGASLVTLPELRRARFEITGTSSCRIALAIGLPYVPESGNAYYSATMSDGTDSNIPRVADTAGNGNGNCSEGLIDGFYAPYAGWYAQIYHGSASGQSVVWTGHRISFQPVMGGYLNPLQLAANAEMSFNHVTSADCEDYVIRTSGSNRPRTYIRPYIEAAAAFLCDGSEGNSPQSSTIIAPYLRTTTPHPSGATLVQRGQGPLTVFGGTVGCSSDAALQIRNEGGNANEASNISLFGVNLQGAPTFTGGQPARGYGDARCCYDMSGDVWELDLEEDPLSGGAHIRTFAFSSANLTSAGCFSYPWPNTTIAEVYLAQVVKCIRYLATANGWGITAWVDQDQTRIWFASTTLGAASRIRITTHARASKVDASVPLGITAATFAGAAANALCTETAGWIDSIGTLTSPGTVCAAKATTSGCNFYNTANAQQSFPELNAKHYGTVTNRGVSTMGNRFGPPGGTFTLSAAATKDVADTRVTATSMVRLMPTNASAATLMAGASSLYQVVASTVAGTSFRVATADAAAAAGTETFSYTIEEPWT